MEVFACWSVGNTNPKADSEYAFAYDEEVRKESMKAKQDWQFIGRFVGTLVQLFTIISNVFKKAEVGLEAIEWLVNSGKSFLTGKLTEIIEEYKRQNSQLARPRLVSDYEVITIDATDGSVTITGSNLFKGGIYNYSGVTLGVQGQARGSVRVSIHEQSVDGNFSQIIGGLGCRFLTEHQVVSFVRKNWERLRKEAHVIFIPFMVGNEELVANVYFDDRGQLDVFVYRFSDGGVWDARYRHRIVVPQQESLAPSVP